MAGEFGVNASVPGPVRLKPGEVIFTVALLVPTSWYLAACGEPVQVSGRRIAAAGDRARLV